MVAGSGQSGAEKSSPKYPRPKILLIDIEKGAKESLQAKGFNVQSGSFGTPYKVPRNDEYFPVITNGDLPNFPEQEVVVVDLVPSAPLPEPGGEKQTSPGELDWWASQSRGVIDPRPRLMIAAQDYADRIVSNGGIFVVFADDRDRQKLSWAYKHGYSLHIKEELPYDDWSFLSILARLRVDSDPGEEMSVVIDVTGPHSLCHSR